MKNKKPIKISSRHIKNMIRESINEVRQEVAIDNSIRRNLKKVLRESEDFVGHAHKATSNWGGNEIQVSDRGDAARLKLPNGEITDWLEIEFDENGVAYVTTPEGDVERLDDYMQF